jgi:hypothetical protein
MKPYTLRDSTQARRFLVQGLWWQRVLQPSAGKVREVLGWLKELASEGHPLPPPGFVADLGHLTFGEDWDSRGGRDAVPVPNLPMNLVRTYEDHVLGKVYADWTFSRASDALRHYKKGRDQARGLAYFINQFRERAGFPGRDDISPGVLTSLLEAQPEELLSEGYESLRQDGLHPLLPELYEGLIAAARRTAEVLGPEDVFDLERKSALDEFGQRLAHRQVLKAAGTLEAALPRNRLRPLARRMEVPTRILDEDTYPVGGFTSISNRGSVESLLHSQLAYIEPDPAAERPDLFEIKFLRDELLYYSRDENQFLRRRRTFVFALSPALVEARFKDYELPYQRVVMLLGLLVVVVRKLTEWLSTDALNFHFVFLGGAEKHPLNNERGLLEKLLYEGLASETVHLDYLPAAGLAGQCEEWSRRSMVHCLVLGVHLGEPDHLRANSPSAAEEKVLDALDPDDTAVCRLAINAARPALGDGLDRPAPVEGEDALGSWSQTLQQILQRWI